MFSFSSKSKQEKGQGLVEYAVIIALVAVVVIGVMKVLGPKISCTFDKVNSSLPGEGGGSNNCGSNEEIAAEPIGPQDFGSTQWKNGFDDATPINNYCASEGSGARYNFYHVDAGSYTYYIASGYPQPSAANTFLRTGTCP